MRFVVAAISLLLLITFALTVTAWVRSYYVIDEWSMANDEGQVVAVVSYQGAIHHTRAGGSAASRRWSYDAHRIPYGATWAHFYTTPGQIVWKRFGFVRLRSTTAVAAAVVTGAAPFGPSGLAAPNQATAVPRQTITPWLIMSPYEAWAVPYWAMAAATGFVPAVWVRLFVRRVYRRRNGLCTRCGYDLRASGERCPECGASFKAAKGHRSDAVMAGSSLREE
jgi:hypothetical protein